MTNKELIQQLSSATSLSKTDTEALLNATSAVLKDELLAGRSVVWQGFGSLELKYKSARTVIHPKSGEKTEVPDKLQLSFKAAESLKERLKNA